MDSSFEKWKCSNNERLFWKKVELQKENETWRNQTAEENSEQALKLSYIKTSLPNTTHTNHFIC